MTEDIGKIIRNGFETYTKNLNLSIPFVLNIFIICLLAFVLLGVGFIFISGSSLPALKNAASPQAVFSIILSIITQHIVEIAVLALMILLIIFLFGAFFTAGAIGMAKQATETGKSELSTMIDAGKKNFVNLFLADVLFSLLSLAGIVFIVPGAMKINIDQLFSPEIAGAALLLIGGILLWIIYLFILNIILAVFRYALVIENLGPIDGIVTGLRFFNTHKLDVFLLFLVVIGIAIILAIIDQVMGFIPVINLIWPFISMFISTIILPPIMTVWWVRLYMTGTDRNIYFNELLAHPDELEKFKASQ
jgi:hypothetical protein